MGGIHSPPLPPYDDYINEILTFIAFCKVLLTDVKFKILLFSWHFLVFPCICHSSLSHLFTPSFLGKPKVLRWYIYGPSFIYFCLAVPKVSNARVFIIAESWILGCPPPPPPLTWPASTTPSLLCLCITSVKLLNDIKKMLTFKAVSKLLLGDVKVEKYC